MIVRVTLKHPDTMPDACLDAARSYVKNIAGLDDKERKLIADDRKALAQAIISSRWMSFSEYLTVEFDTDALTAIVIPNSQLR